MNIDLNKLGFESESLAVFQRAIARPWGIILVSGPTGSGKTNTLYSAISTLNGMEKNIMTAEDPVEFYIPGINQVNIRDEINLNFAAALRAFLRQDPDIMLIGEMRDQETVDVAIKAALTGHLVFSTIHTNDSAATIHRLMNMNIEPFLIADSLASSSPSAWSAASARNAPLRRSCRSNRWSRWASPPRKPKRRRSCRAAGAISAIIRATRAGPLCSKSWNSIRPSGK